MTRDEWLASDDPEAMLEFLDPGDEYKTIGVIIDSKRGRKFRLFACAVARRQGFMSWSSIRHAEMTAEGWPRSQLAWVVGDFQSTTLQEDARYAARQVAGLGWGILNSIGRVTQAEKADILRDTIGDPFADFPWDPAWVSRDAMMVAQAAYGERLKGVDSGDAGRSGITKQAIAVSVEHDTGVLDPQALRELSDCLEEAGCVGEVDCPGCVEILQPDRGGLWPCKACGAPSWLERGKITHPVLDHLRSPGPKYRGMWSLDLVLGKG